MIAAIAVIGAVHWILDHGYRGISYASVRERLQVLDSKSLNVALSHRPEIWAAAVRMYLAFPFFGLGQGAFYRLSAVPEFSRSEFLVGMVGEGVHNEFLRILVELGPVGLGLMLFIAIPFIRLGRQNFPMGFVLCAGRYCARQCLHERAAGARTPGALCRFRWLLFLGGANGRVATWRPPTPATTRYAAVALAALTLAALSK